MSAKATKSTPGREIASRTSCMPRSPAPIMPSRTRSLAPRTVVGAAKVVARPDATVPIKLRRELMGIWSSILPAFGYGLVLDAGDGRCAQPINPADGPSAACLAAGLLLGISPLPRLLEGGVLG